MPELPEVETLRLQLSHLLLGTTIKNIQVLNPKSFIGEKKLMLNTEVRRVRRFAKMLIIDFSNNLSLAIHLKMSGQLIYRSKRKESRSKNNRKYKDKLIANLLNKHTRVMITLGNQDKLFFNDVRKFGWMRIIQNQNNNLRTKIANIKDLTRNLGPEPLKDLTLEKFRAIIESPKRPIKLILMGQEKIAGVGNIYANEALFSAGINPKKKAFELSKNQAARLLESLNKILLAAIKWKGASRQNFCDIFGQKGEAQEHFLAYDREGEKCPNNCGEKIKRIKLGGRGTFYCPKCQR